MTFEVRLLSNFLSYHFYFQIFCIGFAFTEAGVNRSSTSKVVCCHFSSDGKFLASAGHDKRVFDTAICFHTIAFF